MEREELLRSPEYWISHIQNDLYDMMEKYRLKHNMKKKDIADTLKVSKGYISQVLNGDFDHKISKLVKLSLAFNKAPVIVYRDLDEFIREDGKSDSTCLVEKNTAVQYFLSVNSQAPIKVQGEDVRRIEEDFSNIVSHDWITADTDEIVAKNTFEPI